MFSWQFQEDTPFHTLSPVCISLRNDHGRMDYLAPTDPRYELGLLIKADGLLVSIRESRFGFMFVSSQEMEDYVRALYEKFNTRRKSVEAQLADEEDMKLLEDIESKVKKNKKA